MSVQKDKRKTGDLDVNTKARAICVHVLHITKTVKNFPPEQEAFTQRIRDLAIQIDLDCWNANNIKVGDSVELYHDRLKLEEKAARECTDMLELINIARPLYHMRTDRYVYLTNEYVALRKMIRNWYRSDRERLRPQSA